MTNKATRNFDPRKTYTKRLPISNLSIRKVSVTLRPVSLSPSPGVWVDGFKVDSNFEFCDNGEWKPGFEEGGEAFTFEDGVKLASEYVDSFMEDSFLRAEYESQCC